MKLQCWSPRLAALLLAATLTLAPASPPPASAQATGDDGWAEPVNLSRSGTATNPSVVVDSDGSVHAVWQDAGEEIVHAQLQDGGWSEPQPTALRRLFDARASQTNRDGTLPPPTGPNPLFLAGPGRTVFAFWISPQGALFYTRALSPNIQRAGGWNWLRQISSSAASVAAAFDERGELHVAFLRTEDAPGSPAGVYYTRSKSNGADWSPPALLYASPYFRGLEAGEADLGLATGGMAHAPSVHIVWDNRPRKQVFLASSADGGATWAPPAQVAGPSPDADPAGPSNIRVGARGTGAVLVWQSGRGGGDCTLLYRSSADSGATWTETRPMTDALPGCAKANDFVPAAGSGDGLYLLTSIQSQVFLSAWNGSRWSEPQAQPMLSGFEEPEIHADVVYDCLRAVMSAGRLYAVGCDRGEGGDVWAMSRDMGTTAAWFQPPAWSRPAPLADEALEAGTVELAATGDGLIHAVFTRPRDPDVYHTRWDGAAWSRVTPVLRVPEGEAGWPALAAGPGNQLFLVARSSRGSLYFSRATSRNAARASGWSAPERLGIAHEGRLSPADVVWDSAGTLHVAYSVPLNDGRGIYLVQSTDRGKTWSQQLQVFDGAANGFDLVGPPSLLASGNGAIHLLWDRQSIPVGGVSGPVSLHYARSEDGGLTFGPAERVAEGPVAWRTIAADGMGNVHRLWQRADTMTTLWDQVSSDGGRTWQTTRRLPADGGAATVTTDAAGRLHVVEAGPGTLGHWLWDGSRWQSETRFRWSLASPSEGPAELPAAAVNPSGEMVVVFSGPASKGSAPGLLFATRALDLPPIQVAIQGTPSPSPSSPLSIVATPQLGLSPTPRATPAGAMPRTQTPVANPSPFAGWIPPAEVLPGMASIVLWALLLFATPPVGYLVLLALASLRPARRVEPSQVPMNRFLIAIPAHDEQSVVGATVDRLMAMDYPKELFAVHVVADHCTDQTAAFARQSGATVHERREGPSGSKGAALAWLLGRVLPRGAFDAVVVFDADTQAAPAFLRLMDARLALGAQVVQGQHVIRNARAGGFASLVEAMFLIDNRFQNLGRANLGLSAKHMGDSICFRAAVLREIAWAEGLTDDYQLRQRLLLAGLRIAYEPGAIGSGEAPANFAQARAQRARWLRGTRDAGRLFRRRLLVEGIRHRDSAMIDGAVQSYFPSYSTLTTLAVSAMSLLLGVGRSAGPVFPAGLVGAWATIAAVLLLYPFFGLALAGAPARAYRAILSGPFYVGWRTWLALAARLGRTPVAWIRTPHGQERAVEPAHGAPPPA